jgi:hypothetical protein
MAANLDLVSVDYLDTWVIWSDFLWLIGGDWRKVPFDDQQRRTFKMAARQPYWISFLSII